MKIRLGTLGDIPKIVEIERKTWGKYAVLEPTILSLLKAFPTGLSVIEEREMMGYCGCEKQPGAVFLLPYNHNVEETHDPNGSLLYVDIFTIDDRFRSKGIGSKLSERLDNIAIREKCKAIYFPLNKTHPYMQQGVKKFWEKNGYEVLREDKWEIITGEIKECFVMVKRL
ncbi:MAG: GNAT family N-acetyltransferase [Candidatus Aenigmarchaeota archaeon]|nr:GNAT family N-acetyltransferase [Candidatus Aenigmarchaeota archaeon]